jgi:hypothetical protein
MLIDDQAALTLRRQIYAVGQATKADLIRLIEMGRSESAPQSRAFTDLLCDVALDSLLNEVDPPNYIQPGDADWLVKRLSKDGGLANPAEYQMLIRVIRQAVSVPPALAAFAVAQIERAIIAGAARHPSGVVTQAALDALRIVVYAATEGSSLHVTRDSAEALFRMADALADAANPAFEDLFARAIGNYVMGIAFRWTPSAGERKQVDQWLDSPAPSLGEFMSSMLDFSRIGDEEDTDAVQNAADERERARAEKIDAGEAEWLIARLNRDGRISAAEKRLLRFIKEESPSIAPALAALIDKAA